jgi:hypothetical protein
MWRFRLVHFLGTVKPVPPYHRADLHGLAVDDTGRGFRHPLLLSPDTAPQARVDRIEDVVVVPLSEIEIGVDGLPVRQIVREKTPLAPRPSDVQDAVEDLPAVVFWWSATCGMIAGSGRNEIGNEMPLVV